jgi:glycosyltransferase 2 family protein
MAGLGAWRRILHIVGIVFGLALLAQQIWQGYIAIQQLQTCVLRPSYFVGVLGLYVAAYFVQIIAWALIMRSLQAPLSPSAVLKGYAISFLPRYIPGTVWGYLSRNEWLAQTHGIPYSVSTVASLLEAGLLLVTAVALGAFYWVDVLWKVPVAVIGFIAMGITWVAVPWLASRFGGKRLQLSLVDLQYWQAKRWYLGVYTVALYLLFWVLQGGAILYTSTTLCVNAPMGLLEGMAAVSLSWALGFVILFVPAGLGVREWSLSALLVNFAGLESGAAAVVAVVSRVALICAEIIVLLIGLQIYIRGWWNKRA